MTQSPRRSGWHRWLRRVIKVDENPKERLRPPISSTWEDIETSRETHLTPEEEQIQQEGSSFFDDRLHEIIVEAQRLLSEEEDQED